MQFAAATALNNLFAFVFGDYALYLEEQLIFRRSRNRAIDEGDFDSELFEFFNQHELMGIRLCARPERRAEDRSAADRSAGPGAQRRPGAGRYNNGAGRNPERAEGGRDNEQKDHPDESGAGGHGQSGYGAARDDSQPIRAAGLNHARFSRLAVRDRHRQPDGQAPHGPDDPAGMGDDIADRRSNGDGGLLGSAAGLRG
jgi:hypothetical protein